MSTMTCHDLLRVFVRCVDMREPHASDRPAGDSTRPPVTKNYVSIPIAYLDSSQWVWIVVAIPTHRLIERIRQNSRLFLEALSILLLYICMAEMIVVLQAKFYHAYLKHHCYGTKVCTITVTVRNTFLKKSKTILIFIIHKNS